MSQRVKMSRFHEEKMRQALQKLAKDRSLEGNYGIVDFNYEELLLYTDNSIRNKSYISAFLNTLEDQGKIRRIRKGSPVAPSRWSVREFIESNPDAPDTAVSVVKEPTQVKVVESNNTETIAAIKDAIHEMSEYLRELPDQMIAHLHELSKDLDLTSGEQSEELKGELESIKSQVRDLNKQLELANIERTQLAFDLTIKSQELEQRREIPINKDAVVRFKHNIMDEVERFLSAEDWKRRNMKDHFRASVIQKLDGIMTEVGVGEA